MGISDLSAVFDSLDVSCRGYLTCDDILQFYESLYYKPVAHDQVEASISLISKDSKKVQKTDFSDILIELNRRHEIEDKCYWDFQALDKDGTHTITLESAVLLLKNTHGQKFSLLTWKKFLASRAEPESNVAWCEIRMWLCDLPVDSSSDCNDYVTAEIAIEYKRKLKNDQNYGKYINLQHQDSSLAFEAQEREEYQNKVKKYAKRKHMKWDREGVAVMIHDDASDLGDDVIRKLRDGHVNINEVLDALLYKYDLLRTSLFWEMLPNHIGEDMWVAMTESEHAELFHQIQLREKHMRKDDILKEDAGRLPGSQLECYESLIGLMGETTNLHLNRKQEALKQQIELEASGKTVGEIDSILKQKFNEDFKGPKTSEAILIDLDLRYKYERDNILSKMKSSKKLTAVQLVTEYCKLIRQHIAIDAQSHFNSAAIAAGLAERSQEFKTNRFEFDRDRHETLAKEYLIEFKNRRHTKLHLDVKQLTKEKQMGTVDLQIGVVKEIAMKHQNEQQVLIQMLQGQKSAQSKALAGRMTAEDINRQLVRLRNQRDSWREGSAEYKLSQKASHLRILQSGVGIYYELEKRRLKSVHMDTSDEDLNKCIIADLLQKQHVEFEYIISEIQHKSPKELHELWIQEQCARIQEYYDLLAALTLGSLECSETELEYLNVLDKKYDLLRNKLLTDALSAQLGMTWKRLSDEERHRQLIKKREDEKRLRQEGKLDEMDLLLGPLSRQVHLHVLMGNNRAEHSKVVRQQEEQAVLTGRQDVLFKYEESPDTDFTNPLADLQHRYFSELEAIISYLRSPNSEFFTPRVKQMLLVQLKLETRLIEKAHDFTSAAYSVGLMERIDTALVTRHTVDQNRQYKLSECLIEYQRGHLSAGRKLHQELDDHTKPQTGDIHGWQEAYVKEMHKKHVDELQILLNIIMDTGFEELKSVAEMMSTEEQATRLQELHNKRRWLDIEKPENREENIFILEEAAAISYVYRKNNMSGNDYSMTTSIVVELLQEQDKEMANLLRGLCNQDESEIVKGCQEQINARHWGAADNVVTVLTRYECKASEEELLKALDDKYETLKDKLIIERLMIQKGVANWKTLNEEDRLRELNQLRVQERKLHKAGKYEDMKKLLGEDFDTNEKLKSLFGDYKYEYEKKFKDQTALMQKRKEQGLYQGDVLDIDEEDDNEGGNALIDLNKRYEHERETLLHRLRGAKEQILNDHDRQVELVRLWYEELVADKADGFESAAVSIGLAERQQTAAFARLKNDRLRQENLARQILEKPTEGQTSPTTECGIPIEEVCDDDHKHLMVAVISLLEKKHTQEREIFRKILKDESQQDLRLEAKFLAEDVRQEKLKQLNIHRHQLPEDDKSGQYSILCDGTAIKVESCHHHLSLKMVDVSYDYVAVSLMANLQEKQNQEVAHITQQIVDKSKEELIGTQKDIITDIKTSYSMNIADIIFNNKANQSCSDRDLVDALDEKYDTLRDKLLAEALMKQYGEADWQQLSEKERQRKLLELKLEERRLRQEGRLDDAAALIGNMIKDQEALDKLYGNTKEEQERKLRERLQRRKQRQAGGMSVEECNRLEESEIAEEEEERKKRKNILLDLQHRYDQEKDELLRHLRDMTDHNMSERERQLALARLRQQQRRARLEDKFDAAVLALSLAKKGEQAYEDERVRQEQLARVRLEARKKCQNGSANDTLPVETPLPVDETDLISMQDAVVKEMECKHQEERLLLIKLIEDCSEESRLNALSLNLEQQQDKLNELFDARKFLRDSGQMDKGDQLQIFEEGIPVKLALVAHILESEGKPSSHEDLQVSVLADLQQQQDLEITNLMADISEKSSGTLKQLKLVQSMARVHQWNDNIALTLLAGGQKTTEEEEVIRALEQKYDVLRDKLLTEALMKQYGDAEWNRLSERDRQKKLIKLKLEEKKLRQEGRFDEASSLLGDLLKTEADLQERLGNTKAEQKRLLEERLAHRKQLASERAAQGLSIDDSILDTILEEEESKRRKNVLENIQNHFDEEKEALLQLLRNQKSSMEADKQRQFELAKLRREQKRLQMEDKFDTAAILIKMSSQADKDRETRLAQDRERQLELARQRLAIRRQKAHKADNNASELQKKLQEEDKQNMLQDALNVNENDRSSLQSAVLMEVEEKHASERDLLISLIEVAEADTVSKKAAADMTLDELILNLQKLQQGRLAWVEKMMHKSVDVNGISDSERQMYLANVACERAEQFKLLTEALVYRIQGTHIVSQNSGEQSVPAQQQVIDIGVALLADLQEKQSSENSASIGIVQNKDEETLRQIKEVHRRARREGWMTNVTHTIFFMPQKTESVVVDDDNINADIDAEFEEEKQNYIKKMKREAKLGEDIDSEALLRELEAQQLARRNALLEQKRKQKQDMLNKLEARRMAKESEDYEKEAAVAMVRLAAKNQANMLQKNEDEKGRQGDLMRQRLEARREARKEAALREKEAEEQQQSMMESRSTSASPHASNNHIAPFGGLRKREKTVVDVELSESQKQDQVTLLVEQQKRAENKISAQIQRQEEKFQHLLERRKGQRYSDAAALLSLGDRQKTILEKSQKDEKERQLTMMKERVQRVRFERTQTMMQKSGRLAKKFDDLLAEEEREGYDNDEKMKLVAEKMMVKFKLEENEVITGKKKTDEDQP